MRRLAIPKDHLSYIFLCSLPFNLPATILHQKYTLTLTQPFAVSNFIMGKSYGRSRAYGEGAYDFAPCTSSMSRSRDGHQPPNPPPSYHGYSEPSHWRSDVFDQEHVDPDRHFARRGSHQGPRSGAGMTTRQENRVDDRDWDVVIDKFDAEDFDHHIPSMRVRRGTGPEYDDDTFPHMYPYDIVPSRASNPQTAPTSRIHELEAKLNRAEVEKEMAELEHDRTRAERAVLESNAIKKEIYKIDPDSGRIDNAARQFMHLPRRGQGSSSLYGPQSGCRSPPHGRDQGHGRVPLPRDASGRYY